MSMSLFNLNPIEYHASLFATLSWVDLGMSFHSIAIVYDNFEYEEPEK